MSPENCDYYFLRAEGEMGELTRAKDWSKTSIGHPSGWPASLRTTVGILLNSKSPMFLWWSDELICFYNDAYRPSLEIDGKHPSILGMPFKEAWPEIWETIGPLIDKVMNNGESLMFDDYLVPIYRNGRIEDAYWTFCYNPVHNDSGKVGGVLVTVSETTEKVITALKIEEIDQRFRNTMKQAPVGITILRGPQYIVEMANDAYLQLVDKAETEFTNKPLFESLPEIEETVHALLDNVLTTGVPYRGIELPIPTNRYGVKDVCYFDFIYYPLKEDGTITGVIVVVTEVTDKVETRKKIEESKRLYETIAQNTPDLIYAFDLNYRFTYANEALLKMWGCSREDAIGKGFLELGYEPWHAEMHEREIDQVIATKKPIRGEVSFPHAELGIRIYDYIFAPVINKKGEVEAITGTGRDNSDIKKAENELKKSEEQFSTLADNMENLAWLADGEGWIYWYNKRWLEYTGLTMEEMQGWGWQKVHHPDHVERVLEVAKKVWHVKETFELTFPLRRHDGEYRWFLTRGYPVTDEEGKIVRWIGTNTDITEQKKAEEQFKVLADQAPMWVWLTDKEVNVLYTNPEVLRYFGIAHYTEFTGYIWEQNVHPDDIPLVYRFFGEAASLQQSFSFEIRVLNPDNQQYEWFFVKAVPRLEEGEFTGFIGTGININEQKNFTRELEDKVLLRTAELKASEEKFYKLFNLSPICKSLTDAITGKIVMVNDTFTQIFGYSREETFNKTTAEVGKLDILQPDFLFNELKVHGKINNLEIEFTKKSGEKFFALTSVDIITLDDKEYFLGAYIDISGRKWAEKVLEQKNIELERMNKELQSFAYISSHDLQEPLRKIQTFASRILEKEEGNLSDYGKDIFNRMQNAAKRMQTLIQDLLAYSGTNKTESKFETTDLNKIIAEIKEDFKEELKEKLATIETIQLGNAYIIPFQFRQLMHNLIGNSLKFSNPKIPPHIKIKSEIAYGINFNIEHLSPQGKYCHISISDNGIGFDQQYSEKIFEVFQRLHPKNEYIGTGIGLSIVKKIVENHHGIITAKGEVNNGATFDIYIPAT
ncbi:PAS domain S-box protein [Aquiflexum sp.]|uniref:PAS domain-containing sensor histidine kinase n=1 Tax=Aquiflexum sp. TaxID=1872584 RepID=UPI0035941ED6